MQTSNEEEKEQTSNEEEKEQTSNEEEKDGRLAENLVRATSPHLVFPPLGINHSYPCRLHHHPYSRHPHHHHDHDDGDSFQFAGLGLWLAALASPHWLVAVPRSSYHRCHWGFYLVIIIIVAFILSPVSL